MGEWEWEMGGGNLGIGNDKQINWKLGMEDRAWEWGMGNGNEKWEMGIGK